MAEKSVAEMSVAEMSWPKRPWPKCPWPKCPSTAGSHVFLKASLDNPKVTDVVFVEGAGASFSILQQWK